MDKLAEFVARHPKAVGAFFVALAAFGAWNTFNAGRQVQRIQFLHGESARAASEALGG